MNLLISLIKYTLSKFNIFLIKIPSKINVTTIIEKTTEHLATHYYIKQLVSFYLIKKRYDSINHLLNELIPIKREYSHLYWINNESSGRGSLDLYRVVKKKDSKYFIKYYFTDSVEYQRILFFNNVLNKLISNKINTIKIESINESEIMTEVVFDFIEDDFQNEKESFNTIIYFLNTMYSDYDSKTLIKNKISTPDFLPNYKNHFEYERSKSIIFGQSDLGVQTLINKLEAKIDSDNLILSHGDIHYGNIRSGCILDWDNFGFYPNGFDVSFAFWKMNSSNISKKNAINFLKIHFFNNHRFNYSDKNKFTRNFIFFLLVFTRNKHEWISKFLLEKY